MITVAVLNISAVFFAYLARFAPTRYCLKIAFFLIFLFLALRFDYGNDYNNYLQGFLNTPQLDAAQKLNDYMKPTLFEPGWVLLYYLFQPFGFFVMVAVLALFTCAVYYRLIAKYVPPPYYWLATFLFAYNPTLLIANAGQMRQCVATNIFLLSIDFLYRKNALGYVLCVLIAASFHKSALILLPLCILGFTNIQIRAPVAFGIFAVFVLMFVFNQALLPLVQGAVEMLFPNYRAYNKPGEINRGLSFIVFGIFFAAVLFCARFQNREESLLFKVAIIHYLLMPLYLIFGMIARTNYFESATIAVLPMTFFWISKPVFRSILIFMVMGMTLHSFYDFFHADYAVKYNTYNTIFEAPEPY